MLGYNVLFQDVDLIWYKDPLEYFENLRVSSPVSSNFDIYMQHDGNHAEFYAPWSGNTGFYFVRRNNPRTQYFLNQLLVSGDLIVATKTHQAPFLALLSEHASLHGLKVKILPTDVFPGGFHYQKQPSYMKNLLQVPVGDDPSVTAETTETTTKEGADPYVFHMSWTPNKIEKIKFLQQMGEWNVKEKCLSKNENGTITGISEENGGMAMTASECCSIKPLVSCHYR